MPRSIVTRAHGASRHPTSFIKANGLTRCGVIGLTGVALTAVWGCAESERAFGDATRVTEDAGDAGVLLVTDTPATNTPSSGTRDATSSGVDTAERGPNSESASDTGSDSASAPDGGGACAPKVCPEATECRNYQAVDCIDGVAIDCKVTNAEADTPCDSGNGACNGEGECIVPDLAVLGTACERDDQCGSRHCASGADGERVCCDTACDGACTTCGAEGHCDATPVQDAKCGDLSCDPSTTCMEFPPNRAVAGCEAFGLCETVQTYCTPDFTAPDVECGDGLVCDGQGACVVDCPDAGAERVCTEECPCETGEGSCTSDLHCADGFVCSPDAAAKLGFPGSSCLPAHCVNDERDEDETSVDCGGGCGCRATYEVVEITGVPEGAGFGAILAMSGDGSAFAANIGREGDRFSPSYPARVDANGVVTELEGFGVSGSAFGINVDGSVIVGDLWCDNPPDCTTNEFYLPFRWTNDETPEVVFHSGSGRFVSATGAIVVGTHYDPETGNNFGFRASVNRWLNIPELDYVSAMSADGEYIAGRLAMTDSAALWSTTLQGLVELNPPSEWLSWSIEVLSDDGHVFAGSAYVDNTTVKPAFIWKDGTFSEFPKLPGADYNGISGISADGTVMVGLSGTNLVQRAFIWDEAAGMRTVLSETVARGLELPVDLEITDVDFLSDDGTILVGWVYGVTTPSFWRVTLLP